MIPVVGWVSTGGKLGIKGYKAVHTLDGLKTFLRGRPTIVPAHAVELPFSPSARFPVGQRWQWREGDKTVTYHAHGTDPARPPTDNAGKGPIYRIQHGNNHYLDADGTKHTRNSLDPNSSAYSPQAANGTHIPYPHDQPRPDRNHVRIVAPNPAALFEPNSDEN